LPAIPLAGFFCNYNLRGHVRPTANRLVFMALCWALPIAAHAGLSGVAVAIPMGDKVTVLVDQRRLTFRLGDIDAPEAGQPFSARAAQALARLCLGKAVTVDDGGIDLPRGIFGHVGCAGVDAAEEQVRRGMAWVSAEAHADSTLHSLQAEAKAQGLGLWIDADPLPPWTWHGFCPAPPGVW